MKMETLKQQILTAKGDVRAELVLKNARVINVFTNEIEQADVAIRQGVILGVGHYTGETELDLQGKYVCPGLVDGHIHIESSMLCGPAFEQAVLPHGTTAVVTDPHEISNVAGTAGPEIWRFRSTLCCPPACLPLGWTSPAQCWKRSSCAPTISSPGYWGWLS